MLKHAGFLGALALSGCVADTGSFCGDGLCSSSESCASCPSDCGSCTTSCALSCSGCCDSEACLGGTSSSACGVLGLACLDCGLDGICQDGECYLDPASRWNVVLETLTVPTRPVDGGDWDAFGGAPDPFVEVRVGSLSASPVRSGIGDNTFTVNFTGGPTVTNVRADSLYTLLRFDVFDLDTSFHDFVGACSLTMLEGEPFTGTSQTLSCPVNPATDNSGFTLRWHLERF